MDTISIKQISAECIIGDLDWERTNKQQIRCDIDLCTDLRQVGTSDRLEDTIDYARVGALAVAYIEESRCAMLEALAEGLATAMLRQFHPKRVKLTLWKKAHFPAAQEVAVTITRP